MKRFIGFLVLSCSSLLVLPGILLADYTIILKNGRRITVQNYREEGGMIKFHGLGGEIGIGKDQVKTILKAGEREARGLTLPSQQDSAPAAPPPPEAKPGPAEGTVPGERQLAEERAEEEKAYQKRLAEVTAQLENAKQRYIDATQGGGISSNVSKEGFKAWAYDLASRIHDSQKAAGAESGANPPFPNYTGREKELSELRIEIDNLQKERDNLIEEMKRKNIPTEGF